VLRYGAFYGPGTSLAPGEEQFELVGRRKSPLVGDGGRVWSFIHIADAAEATAGAAASMDQHACRRRPVRDCLWAIAATLSMTLVACNVVSGLILELALSRSCGPLKGSARRSDQSEAPRW
jgi:hypothetical protein